MYRCASGDTRIVALYKATVEKIGNAFRCTMLPVVVAQCYL
jgi:hypothetical protein